MLQYVKVGDGDEANIVVFIPGREALVAHSSHPNYARIVAGAAVGDESIADLFDIAATVAAKFQRLSERITTRGGRLFMDGEEIANALTSQVLRFLDEGRDDWRPLVAFFENVQANQSSDSRDQLYSWLDREDFAITPDGMIVAYKGVAKTVKGFESISRGRAIVDGVEYDGAIPNHLGAVVEMPRPEVQFDPMVGCSRGLHVGSYAYAEGFARGAILEVHVNPRDVVSVPHECGAQKMRVCRYVTVATTEVQLTSALVYDQAYDQADDNGWGDGDDDGDGWEDGDLY